MIGLLLKWKRREFQMKWIPKDIQTFIEAREYVDTILIPLYGISFTGGISKSAASTEFISIISQQVEKQFKGRVLMLPGVTYCKDWTEEEKMKFILQWKSTIETEKFPFIFFLTVDEYWKLYTEQLGNSLILTPFIPLEDLEERYKKTVIEEEVSEILNKIIHKWRSL